MIRKPQATRVVIATDVRFWHHQTGAQRRIHSMVRYLQDSGLEVITLFAGSLAAASQSRGTPDDRLAIQRSGLTVYSLLEDWQPTGVLARVHWKLKCILNWLSQMWPGSTARNGSSHPVTSSVYLADLVSPLMRDRFQEMVQQLRPDFVIVEYVTLGYLVPDSRADNSPHFLVDTHDLLSDRYRQFGKHGFDHWIRITEDEESRELQKFDTIIAIQEEEQARFRAMTKGTKQVIFAGHPADTDNPIPVQSTLNAKYSLGYFGSDNPSNRFALEWFLSRVWPAVRIQVPEMTLLIAGHICESLPRELLKLPGVYTLPNVSDLRALYQSFQIAINPVQFGTGLKIKNQEALAFGKPLIVTKQGFAGMTALPNNEAILTSSSADEMANQICGLVADPVRLHRAAADASDYARRLLRPERVYAELLNRLQPSQHANRDCPADPERQVV